MYKLFSLLSLCSQNEQQGMGCSPHGCFGGDIVGCILIKLSIFIAAALIFSLIFWMTHNLIVKDKKEIKTKKK